LGPQGEVSQSGEGREGRKSTREGKANAVRLKVRDL